MLFIFIVFFSTLLHSILIIYLIKVFKSGLSLYYNKVMLQCKNSFYYHLKKKNI